MIFNPYFDICSLFFLLLMVFVYSSNRNIFNQSNRIYGVFLYTALANTFLNIISIYVIRNSELFPVWFNYFINILYFISLSLIAPVYAMYSMSLTGILKRLKKFHVISLFTPLIINEIMIISTPWTLWIIDINGSVYSRGSAVIFMYIFSFFYTFLGLLILIINKNKIQKIQYYLLLVFVIMIYTAVMIQFFYPEYMVFGLLITLSLMAMFLTFQNPRENYDKMTNLLARSAFLQVMENIFSKKNSNLQLLIAEIDDIHKIDNIYGAFTGDKLIKQTSAFLNSLNIGSNNIFRIAECRFALLIDNSIIENKAKTIQEYFSSPCRIDNYLIPVNINMCGIPVPEAAKNCEDLLFIIDKLMLLTKSDSKGQYLTADKNVIDKINRIHLIESKLNDSEDLSFLEINFQPVFDIATGRFKASEVLARLNCPKLGLVYPAEFISAAEKNGTISKIGNYVLAETFRFINEHKVWELGIESVAINLSVLNCLQDDFIELFDLLRKKFPDIKTKINFEITESVAVNSSAKVGNVLKYLAENGSDIVVDDFGTGYSNIDIVLKHPFKTIKLDISLLRNSMNNEKSRVFVQGLVKTFRKMKLMVIAEGAETADELEMLKEIGVDMIQGYYLSKPLTEHEYIEFIKSKNFS